MSLATVMTGHRGRGLGLLAVVLACGALCSVSGKAQTTAKGDKAAPAPAFRSMSLEIVGKDASLTRDTVKVINDLLAESWTANKITPADYVDDYEFMRRASLDVIGRIATIDELTKYMKYPQARRRSLVIEDLLASDEYPKHWANLWSNWLLTRTGVFGRGKYHEQLSVWLEDQFANNEPYHKIVQKLLTASGSNKDNGAVNFVLAHVGEPVPGAQRGELGQFEMVPVTSRVTRLFLGMQLQCAQCHDHPFHTGISQKHFWQINAFFRQVERGGTPPQPTMRNMGVPPDLELKENTNTNKDGVVFYEKRNAVVLEARPIFFDDKAKKFEPGNGSRREQLVNFVEEHENFPRAIVNRMWGVFFGRGFTNPIDDFNEQNAPSNPKLLNELSVMFKQYNYDQKKLIRWIMHSNAYHLSYVANKTNDKQEQEALFSRMLLKAMSPEQMFESLMTATNAEQAETKDGKRDLKDKWLEKLVSNFGDDEGNEVNFNGTIVQALMMMNGDDINGAIARKDKGTVALAMKKKGANASTVITDLFLATLNRPPRQGELKLIQEKLPRLDAKTGKPEPKGDSDPAAPYHDVLWALPNSNEFILNH